MGEKTPYSGVGESHRFEHPTQMNRLKFGVPAGWTLQRAGNAGNAALDQTIENGYVEAPEGVNVALVGPRDIPYPDLHQQILAVRSTLTNSIKTTGDARKEQRVPPLRIPFPSGMGCSGRDDNLEKETSTKCVFADHHPVHQRQRDRRDQDQGLAEIHARYQDRAQDHAQYG